MKHPRLGYVGIEFQLVVIAALTYHAQQFFFKLSSSSYLKEIQKKIMKHFFSIALDTITLFFDEKA